MKRYLDRDLDDEEEIALLLGREPEYGEDANPLDIRDYTVGFPSAGGGTKMVISYDYDLANQ